MDNMMMNLRKEYKDEVMINRFIHDGLTEQIIISFDNNKGVSIVNMKYFDGVEIAPIKFNGLDIERFDIIDEPYKGIVNIGQAKLIIDSVKALALTW